MNPSPNTDSNPTSPIHPPLSEQPPVQLPGTEFDPEKALAEAMAKLEASTAELAELCAKTQTSSSPATPAPVPASEAVEETAKPTVEGTPAGEATEIAHATEIAQATTADVTTTGEGAPPAEATTTADPTETDEATPTFDETPTATEEPTPVQPQPANVRRIVLAPPAKQPASTSVELNTISPQEPTKSQPTKSQPTQIQPTQIQPTQIQADSAPDLQTVAEAQPVSPTAAQNQTPKSQTTEATERGPAELDETELEFAAVEVAQSASESITSTNADENREAAKPEIEIIAATPEEPTVQQSTEATLESLSQATNLAVDELTSEFAKAHFDAELNNEPLTVEPAETQEAVVATNEFSVEDQSEFDFPSISTTEFQDQSVPSTTSQPLPLSQIKCEKTGEVLFDVKDFSDVSAAAPEPISNSFQVDPYCYDFATNEELVTEAPEAATAAKVTANDWPGSLSESVQVFLADVGDVVSIDGDDGFDHIDLVCFKYSQARIEPGQIHIDDGAGNHFDVQFRNVEYALFADGVQVHLNTITPLAQG